MPTIGEITANQTLLNNLKQVSEKETESLKPLASGNKINSSKDDAAGLIISNELLTQLNGLDQAARNASDGISLSQVADGGLNAINDGLGRIRELSLQAANGTLGAGQRDALQAEVSQIQEEITNVVAGTNFGGVELFTSNNDLTLQVGAEAGETLSISLQDLSASLSGVSGIDISTPGGADAAFATIDGAFATVNDLRGEFGAVSNRVESVINNNRSTAENIAASRSRITDTNFAEATSEQVRQSLLRNSGNAVQAQANASSQLVVSLLS